MCDLAVQKAFRALITGVRKRFPPGGVVTVLCYVDCVIRKVFRFDLKMSGYELMVIS